MSEFLFFLFLLCSEALASGSTSKLLARSSHSDIQIIHKNLVSIFISFDRERSDQKLKTSFLEDLIFSSAHADGADRCFYGGWISVKTSSGCQEPWRAKKTNGFAKAYAGHIYDAEVSCHDTELIRCNPLLFGASTSEGGKCINMNPDSSLTQRCYEASKELQQDHLGLIQNDPVTREKYSQLVDEVLSYCEGKDSSVECYQLSRQIKDTLDNIAAQGSSTVCHQILDPVVETGAFENILAILDTPPKIVSEHWAPPIDNDYEAACDIEGLSDEAHKNCVALLNSSQVPTNAMLFALDGLKRNANSFETKNCYNKADGFSDVFGHYSTPGLGSDEELVSSLNPGIKNKCTMIINNYDERIKTHGGSLRCKTAMYYIDLCKDSPKVTKSYSYVGYGTCKGSSGFTNERDKGTSLLGFSVTSVEGFNFQKNDTSYKAIRSDLGGTIPAVALFGLQGTNNRSSSDYKYLHVGAYTSAGCPSIAPENAWMVQEMAKSGPSVVVGYKEGQMESFDKCGGE